MHIFKILLGLIKLMSPLSRVFLNPRYLIPLIAIWYKSPNPTRAIKDFFVQKINFTAVIYGILTTVVLVLSLNEHNPAKFLSVLLLSFAFLLLYPLLLLIFNRVHHKNSKRINWDETFRPARDLVVVWFVTFVFSFLTYLFILLISKK